MNAVRELPPGARLYTNGPDAVYLLAGRRVREVPRAVDPTTRRPRPAYAEEMSAVAADTGAYVASFDRIRRDYLPDDAALAARLPLVVVERTPDGRLHRIRGPEG
jgi:hypothetical protein